VSSLTIATVANVNNIWMYRKVKYRQTPVLYPHISKVYCRTPDGSSTDDTRLLTQHQVALLYQMYTKNGRVSSGCVAVCKVPDHSVGCQTVPRESWAVKVLILMLVSVLVLTFGLCIPYLKHLCYSASSSSATSEFIIPFILF